MKKESLMKLEKNLRNIKVEGFIIHQDGGRVFEYFKNKKVKEKPGKIYSVTKSVVSLLIGILIDKGLIDDIHTPIYKYFPEILQSEDQRKREITLFHLLTMTSGFKVGNAEGSTHWVRYLLEQPLLHAPGTTFQYNSGDSHLLSAIIQQITGMTTSAFADKHLFGPLGIQNYLWLKDPQGITRGGFSISMSMEDMMKMGTMLLHGGKFGKQQLVSSNWITESQHPYNITEENDSGTYGYGYQFWTFKSNDADNPIEFYYANGLFGQFIFVVPKLNIVAVAKSQLQKEEDQILPMVYFQNLLQELKSIG